MEGEGVEKERRGKERAKNDVPCAAMKRTLSRSSALMGRGVASTMTVEEEGEAELCEVGGPEDESSWLEDEEAMASVRLASADFFVLVEASARLPPS